MAQPPAPDKPWRVFPLPQSKSLPHVVKRTRCPAPAALGTLALAAAAPAAQAAHTDASLDRLSARHPGQQVEVIVQFKAGTSQKNARAMVRAQRGKPGLALPLITGLGAKMRADGAARL